mmetsp:Transcript_46965/g.142227  ORF Transcript_46965/g.142227 Transcript_46965/m.142227 type:complete len:102 (-) Transcript_46965:931-1236(-)
MASDIIKSHRKNTELSLREAKEALKEPCAGKEITSCILNQRQSTKGWKIGLDQCFYTILISSYYVYHFSFCLASSSAFFVALKMRIVSHAVQHLPKTMIPP